MDDNNEKDIIEQVYAYAPELKESGKSDSQIHQTLIEKGLDEESSKIVFDNMNNMINKNSGGFEFPSWLIWLLLLIGINVLSEIFDWPFWIY